MAIFKSHTLLGKAGKWLNKSAVGKVVKGVVTVGSVALGAKAVTGALKGAGKLVKMGAAAIRDRKIKQDEIVKTLQTENLPVTSESVKEVTNAIQEHAAEEYGSDELPVIKTSYDVKSGGVIEWVKAHMTLVLGVSLGIAVLVVLFVFKPFGSKKVGRRK